MGLFGYTSLKDFFDGGGPGASRDTSKDNKTSNSKTSKAVKSAAKKIIGGIGDFAGGMKNDISMGFNPETRDQDYYQRTMNTINRTRGLEAAQAYYDQMPRDRFGNVEGFSAPTEQLAPRIGGHPGGSKSGGGFVPADVGDDTGPVDEDGNPVDGDGNPIEEEIEYTYMPPFFGGYQPATRADTLVPSQGRGIGSFLPNPRLDPIFPQQPPPDFYKHNGNFDFGAPANLGDTHYNPELDTTYTYQEKPDGQGGFYSGWDITQGNGGKMMLYGGGGSQGEGTNFGAVMPQTNPLTGLPQTAPINNDLSAQGVGNLFGNEQAPPYMYQGIMS